MKRLPLLVVPLALAACARPGDYPISSNCVWTEEDTRTLDLTKSSDRHHLRFDAVTAEDVAIRWADHYVGLSPEYEPRRDQCMETLFHAVAERHGVDVAIVRQYSHDRDIFVDAATILSFSILYVMVAYTFAGRIHRRFPPGEPGFWVMTITMAVGISLVGVMIGMLGSIVVESVRLNSGHLSYRMDRIPWRQHWIVLFVCGFLVFGLVGLIRSRVQSQPQIGG